MPVTIHVNHGDPYDRVLADLRRRRDELDIAITAVEAVRSPQVAPAMVVAGEPTATPVVHSSIASYSNVSIAEASKLALRASGGPLRVVEIVPLIQAGGVKLGATDPNNTVNSILSRRANSVGDIVRVGRSTYALKEHAPSHLPLSSAQLDEMLGISNSEPPPD